jgi:hypothetical protein
MAYGVRVDLKKFRRVLNFPRFDGHGVKVYLSLMEVFKWKEDVNMAINSRLKQFV